MNNLNEDAQRVLLLARKEADTLNHNYTGTEHLLLAIIKPGDDTVAFKILKNLGFGPDPEDMRKVVTDMIGQGDPAYKKVDAAYTPRVKKVLALASKEAESMGHNYIGVEHILFGILSEGIGGAAQILINARLTLDGARLEFLRLTNSPTAKELERMVHKKEVEDTVRSLLANIRNLCNLNEIDFDSIMSAKTSEQ